MKSSFDPIGPLSRRDWLRASAGLGAGAALVGCAGLPLGRAPGEPTLISRENARPGTRDWILTQSAIDPATKYRCPWIEGYCSHTSIRAGETLEIFVSTKPASNFTLDLYRLGYYGGMGGRHVHSFGMLSGRTQEDPSIADKRLRDCRWSRRFVSGWMIAPVIFPVRPRRRLS